MMDNLTLERINTAHPKLRTELLEIYKEICKEIFTKSMCRFAYVIRTAAEQDELYAIGRTKPGKIVTKAKAFESFHNYGLAVDIVMVYDKDGNGSYETASWDEKIDFDGDGKSEWQEVVTIFKKYGWTWGGEWTFRDAPHFEKAFGHSVMDLKAIYESKKLIPNTNYVLI